MSPNLVISAASADSGSQIISWLITNGPVSPVTLKSIKSIINENSAVSAIRETVHPLRYTADEAATLIQNIVLDETLLQLGRTSFVRLELMYSDQTRVLSNILVLSNKKTPNTPVLTIGTSLRSEDSNVAINLAQYGSVNSQNDGFSPITKAIVFISKVGGTSADDFQMINVDITSYTEWLLVNATIALVNDTQYEIALKVSNAVGDSGISNTLTFSPKDTPAPVAKLVVSSLLSDQASKGQTLNDATGSIALYWSKPADYNNLITNNRRVLKYIIKEQLYQDVVLIGSGGIETTVSQASGEPNVIELLVPAHLVNVNSGAAFELPTPDGTGDNIVHYRHIIPGSPARLGKRYTYEVIANNINGDGPASTRSVEVYSFKQADPQPFELIHTSIESYVTATPITLFDGKMIMIIKQLASLNGGKGYSSVNSTFNNPVVYSPPDANDEQLSLKVTKESDSSVIFDGLVTFVKQITSVTTGTGQTAVTTYSIADDWKCDFDKVDILPGTLAIDTLNNALEKGTKYRFQLFRQNKDPANTTTVPVFKSPSTDILRSKFSSPAAVSKLMSYAINDDLTPVTSDGSPALRLLFDELTDGELNGLQNFVPRPLTNYYAYQQSLIVADLAALIHNGQGEPREFIIKQSSTGSQVAQYIRTETWNPELLRWISGAEAAPPVTETPFTYPLAVTAITINKVTANTITIGFTRQPAADLKGSLSSNCQNRIVICQDEDLDPITPAIPNGPIVNELIVQHAAGPTYTSSSITLETGKTYTVFVIPERVYSKSAHNGVGYSNNSINYHFFNTLVRNTYFKENFVMNGIPDAPINIELLPSNKTLSVLYDSPSYLNGVPSESLMYNFFMNNDPLDLDFPYFSKTPTNVFQASVTEIAGSNIATITKAFIKQSDTNSRGNAVDLRNDTEYKFAMRVNGTIGGFSLVRTSYVQSYTSGYVNSSAVSSIISLIANPTVSVSTVIGTMSETKTVLIADNVPAPAGVIIGAAANVLNIEFNKDTSQNVNDALIIIDKNDGDGSTGLPVPAFDTRKVRSPESSSGLFNMENYFTSGTIAAGTVIADYAPFVNYNFKRVNIGGIFKYQLQIPNLINGRPYEVSIRFIRNVNGSDIFSEAVSITRAPEAPPTVVRDVKFAVASQAINLSWTAPANAGGASIGLNGALKYRVQLLSSLDVLLATFETSNLFYNIVSNLIDGTTYKVTIAALYTKGSDSSDVISDPVQANSAAGNLIRPNLAPLGPTLAVTVGTTNTIGGSLILPGSSETNLYPVTRYDVFVRLKTTPLNKVLVQSFSSVAGQHPHGLAYTVNSLSAGSTITLTAITTFVNAASPNTIVHTKPLNGFQYEVVIESIPNYTYAQVPPTRVIDAFPYGPVIITNAAYKAGSASKIFTIVVNTNGTGNINNIVALAKGSTSSAILVSNLSGGTLPLIALSGALDADKAANQIATFELPFLGASGLVSDLLTVVVTALGSDSDVFPISGTGRAFA